MQSVASSIDFDVYSDSETSGVYEEAVDILNSTHHNGTGDDNVNNNANSAVDGEGRACGSAAIVASPPPPQRPSFSPRDASSAGADGRRPVDSSRDGSGGKRSGVEDGDKNNALVGGLSAPPAPPHDRLVGSGMGGCGGFCGPMIKTSFFQQLRGLFRTRGKKKKRKSDAREQEPGMVGKGGEEGVGAPTMSPAEPQVDPLSTATPPTFSSCVHDVRNVSPRHEVYDCLPPSRSTPPQVRQQQQEEENGDEGTQHRRENGSAPLSTLQEVGMCEEENSTRGEECKGSGKKIGRQASAAKKTGRKGDSAPPPALQRPALGSSMQPSRDDSPAAAPLAEHTEELLSLLPKVAANDAAAVASDEESSLLFNTDELSGQAQFCDAGGGDSNKGTGVSPPPNVMHCSLFEKSCESHASISSDDFFLLEHSSLIVPDAVQSAGMRGAQDDCAALKLRPGPVGGGGGRGTIASTRQRNVPAKKGKTPAGLRKGIKGSAALGRCVEQPLPNGYASVMSVLEHGGRKEGQIEEGESAVFSARHISLNRGDKRTDLVHSSKAAGGRGTNTGHDGRLHVNRGVYNSDRSKRSRGSTVVTALKGSYAQIASKRRKSLESEKNATSKGMGEKTLDKGGERECASGDCLLQETVPVVDATHRPLCIPDMQSGSANSGDDVDKELALERLITAVASRSAPYAGLTWREFKAQFYIGDRSLLNTLPLDKADGSEPVSDTVRDHLAALFSSLRPSCAACGPSRRKLWLSDLLSRSVKGQTVAHSSREWLYESLPPPSGPTEQQQEFAPKGGEASIGEMAFSAPSLSSAPRFVTSKEAIASLDDSPEDRPHDPMSSDEVESKQEHAELRPKTKDFCADAEDGAACFVYPSPSLEVKLISSSAVPLVTEENVVTGGDANTNGHESSQKPQQNVHHAGDESAALDAQVAAERSNALDAVNAHSFPGLLNSPSETRNVHVVRSDEDGHCCTGMPSSSKGASDDAPASVQKDSDDCDAARKSREHATITAWMAEQRQLQEQLITVSAERNLLADQLRIYTSCDEAKKRKKLLRDKQTCKARLQSPSCTPALPEGELDRGAE